MAVERKNPIEAQRRRSPSPALRVLLVQPCCRVTLTTGSGRCRRVNVREPLPSLDCLQ